MPRPVARLAVPPNLQPGPRARQGSSQLCFPLSPHPARPTLCLFCFWGSGECRGLETAVVYRAAYFGKNSGPVAMFPSAKQLPPSPPSRTRHSKKGLLLQGPLDKKSGDHGPLSGEPWGVGDRKQPNRPGRACSPTGERERERWERPRAQVPRAAAPRRSSGTKQRSWWTAGGLGGGGGRRSTWATWQPLPAPRDPSPPGRPPALSRRASARLLFPGRTESGSVSPPGALAVSPPRPQLLASPARRGRAQWRRRERAADLRRRVVRSTTRHRLRRPLPAPEAGEETETEKY
nr:translation initiation factor IF-2-like [Gorilla gorilla gorilla]